MTTPQTKVVCFDLGGVLFQIVQDWRDVVKRANCKIHPKLALPHIKNKLRNTHEQFERGEIDEPTFMNNFAQHSGYTPSQVEVLLDAWLLDWYPNVEALLKKIAESEITTACLSNTNPRHWVDLAGVSDNTETPATPLKHLHHLFPSHEIGARKPETNAYQHVEETLDCDGQQILFFDDREENLSAAQKRGWQTILVDPNRDTCSQIESALKQYKIVQPSFG